MATDEKRSTAARIGIELLNLFASGLGLLRVAGLRASLGFLLAPMLVILALSLLGMVAPKPNFVALIVVTAATFTLLLAILVVAIARTWRASRFRAPVTGWSRWYGLCAAALLVSLGMNLATTAFHAIYKPFSIPSYAMVPTLRPGDQILADMRGSRHPLRGQIVLFSMPELHSTYIKRVAALPGDRIAMKDGVPVINGHAASQTFVGAMMWDGQPARRLREILPGETGSHEVIDLGISAVDTMPERIVPANSLFVLGDNRDSSADSRMSRADYGVDWVPMADLIGTPILIYWSHDRQAIGKTLSR